MGAASQRTRRREASLQRQYFHAHARTLSIFLVYQGFNFWVCLLFVPLVLDPNAACHTCLVRRPACEPAGMGLRQLWTIAVASAAVSLLCSIPCSHAIRASSDLSSDSRSTLRVLEAAGVFPSNTHGANARKRARRHGARPNGTSSNFMNTTETPFSRNGSTTNSLETTTSANGTSPVVEVTTSSAVDTTTETSAPLPEESLADTAVDFLPVGLVTRPPSVQAKVGLRAQQHPHPPLDQDATATCPLSTQLEAPRPVYLTTCAEFSSESCCTQDEDQAVLAMLQQSFEPLCVCSSCNVPLVRCASCAPVC